MWKNLNQFGIYPDVIICRCQKQIYDDLKEKISLHCNVKKEAVISGIDVEIIYEMPLLFHKQGLGKIIANKFNISTSSLEYMVPLVETLKKHRTEIRSKSKQIQIALCGKYNQLEDSYASIHEALSHASAHLDVCMKTFFVDTSHITKEDVEQKIKGNGWAYRAWRFWHSRHGGEDCHDSVR